VTEEGLEVQREEGRRKGGVSAGMINARDEGKGRGGRECKVRIGSCGSQKLFNKKPNDTQALRHTENKRRFSKKTLKTHCVQRETIERAYEDKENRAGGQEKGGCDLRLEGGQKRRQVSVIEEDTN